MGIVQKQGIQNAIILYTGVLLGAFNKYILFSHILGGDKMGLTDVLLFSALIFAQVAKLGSGSMLIRFFPYFLRHPQKQASFYFLNLFFYPIVGFLLVLFGTLLFKTQFLSYFSEKSALFVDYYYYIFPLTLGYTLFSSLFSFSQGNLKTVVPVAIQEVGVRFWQAAAVLAFHFQLIDFELFLLLYSLTYWVNGSVLVGYLLWLGRLKFSIDFGLWGTKLHRLMWRMGMVSFLSRVAETVKDNLSGIQLAALVGLNGTAIYTLSSFIALMIYIPARAMGNIALPLIIRDMQANNLTEVKILYQKSAITGLVVGMFIFLLIVINLDVLIALLPKHKFTSLEVIKPMTFCLAISRIFDVANGVNAAIIEYAKKTYQYTFFTNLLMILVILGFNILFVHRLGLVGAGIATALSMLLYNSLNTFIVWKAFHIQPFSPKSLYPILLGTGLLTLYHFTPIPLNSLWFTLPISLVTGIFYLGVIYFCKVSEDINKMVEKVLKLPA